MRATLRATALAIVAIVDDDSYQHRLTRSGGNGSQRPFADRRQAAPLWLLLARVCLPDLAGACREACRAADRRLAVAAGNEAMAVENEIRRRKRILKSVSPASLSASLSASAPSHAGANTRCVDGRWCGDD